MLFRLLAALPSGAYLSMGKEKIRRLVSAVTPARTAIGFWKLSELCLITPANTGSSWQQHLCRPCADVTTGITLPSALPR